MKKHENQEEIGLCGNLTIGSITDFLGAVKLYNPNGIYFKVRGKHVIVGVET